jgi:hypothetical protein
MVFAPQLSRPMPWILQAPRVSWRQLLSVAGGKQPFSIGSTTRRASCARRCSGLCVLPGWRSVTRRRATFRPQLSLSGSNAAKSIVPTLTRDLRPVRPRCQVRARCHQDGLLRTVAPVARRPCGRSNAIAGPDVSLLLRSPQLANLADPDTLISISLGAEPSHAANQPVAY